LSDEGEAEVVVGKGVFGVVGGVVGGEMKALAESNSGS